MLCKEKFVSSYALNQTCLSYVRLFIVLINSLKGKLSCYLKTL